MSNTRKPFMPISNDDDDELERLARLKGVGKFETPGSSLNRAGEGGSPQEALLPTPPTAAPFASIDVCKINFEAPGYLGTALKIQAAQLRTSVRHVILKALKEAGFEVRDADMIEDGRRLRGSNRLN